jgi:glycosyltransferase involved in cell wall biosynthesis
MQKLVSVIIPCFNAEKWLAEAIDSCLQQTYSHIEVIVIDDGSTDNSLEILKGYGDKIIWERLPHKGANHARNRGFALSKGEYIQYLDADDYLLPEKIENQVRFLEETGADVVYGDWRHQYHLPNGKSYQDKIEKPGTQEDILESLLANWWTAVASILYRRTVVEKSGGWDKSFQAAQDRDFFLSVVIHGAKVVYQPGCYAIYRRYGNVTISTSSKPRWIESHCAVLEKAERQLKQMNKLLPKYRNALAKCYFELAREWLSINEYSNYLKLLEEALIKFPNFKRSKDRRAYYAIQSICGFRCTERIVCRLLMVKRFVNSIHEKFLSPEGRYKLTLF